MNWPFTRLETVSGFVLVAVAVTVTDEAGFLYGLASAIVLGSLFGLTLRRLRTKP